jgi:hypothetical protein
MNSFVSLLTYSLISILTFLLLYLLTYLLNLLFISSLIISFTYLLIYSYSFVFRDNLDAAVTSLELIAQTERLTLVLETRYVDDSLIPGKPEHLLPSSRMIGSHDFILCNRLIVIILEFWLPRVNEM